MLATLELRDFAIVDELRIDLADGFNVLTGETGAGKSILVDALSLLTGGRGDAALIRAGRDSALVQGIFDPPPAPATAPATAPAAAAAAAAGGGVHSAARRLVRSGRNTARLDGELVTVAELAERAGSEVAIFGQHASQRLLDAAEQRAQLDRILPPDALEALAGYRARYAELQRVGAELAELREAARERVRQLDVLRFQLDEIDAARLSPDEGERLEREAVGLRHAERILQGVGRAAERLSEAEPSALELLAEALRDLEGAGRFHPTAEALAGDLREALSSVQAIAGEVDSFAAEVDLDPARLEQVEARLAEIARLERKYGDGVEAVLAFRARVAAQLERLDNAEASLEALDARRLELEAELRTLGGVLTAARRAAGAQLAKAVVPLLRRLGMPNARFEATLEASEAPTPHGLERVRFAFSANLGEPLGPLAAVASGGELSRVMLAINVVTGSDAPTLVFDEVDAGIGGSAARAVGELLRQLSESHQVLVVTHLPQVAAFADAQFFVSKREKAGRTVTSVTRLEAGEREAELARMLSGAVTDASLENARELISASQPG